MTDANDDLSKVLFNFLSTRFNQSELNTLCFKLGLDYEELAGDTRSDKVRELILYCQRHGWTPGLLQALQQERPQQFQEVGLTLPTDMPILNPFPANLSIETPYPIAFACHAFNRAMDNTKVSQFISLDRLIENLIKYLVAIALTQYWRTQPDKAQLRLWFGKLSRPSLSTWLEVWNEIGDSYAHDPKPPRLIAHLYDKYRVPLADGSALVTAYEYIVGQLEKEHIELNDTNLTIGVFLRRLLQYRHLEWEGRAGQIIEETGDALLILLQPALQEILLTSPVITQYNLHYFERVDRLGEEWHYERLNFQGNEELPAKLKPLRLTADGQEPAHKPRRLYLCDASGTPLLNLHPMLIAYNIPLQLYFFDYNADNQEIRYLHCGSPKRVMPPVYITTQLEIDHILTTEDDGASQGPVTSLSDIESIIGDLVGFYQVLMNAFNREELIDLCFRLEVNYDYIQQDSKGEFVVALLQYVQQREGLLVSLVNEVQKLRPNVVKTEMLSSFDLKAVRIDQSSVEILENVAEAKLVLVGDGNVGKTSLVNRLVHSRFDSNESTTRGIAFTRWHIGLPCIDDQYARINIWDFGGQGHMHATHPYFFSRQAVYLVVLNVREDDRFNRVEYWIRLIQAFGSNSPIIIVANKIDQFSTHLDQRTLKDKYPQISGFALTSCKTGEGIPKLKSNISKAVCSLKDINVRMSQRLVKVKHILEDMTDPKSAQTRDTLSLEEYKDIRNQNSVAPEQNIRYLQRFRDLGIVLYFGDDPRLNLDVVLNPFWVIEGVYKIINHAPLELANGILRTDQVRNILPSNRYPSAKAMYIIDIMRKFELCFPLDDQQTQYLLPDLLSRQQPILPVFNREDTLKFHFEYPVWQEATLTRLIVRLHYYLIENCYWRNGVLLRSADGKNRALIIADKVDRRLRVWVDGERSTRRNFLNRIREELNLVHKIQRNQYVKEWVIIPEGGEISYSFLANLESKGREYCDIEVGNDVVTLNIKEVLDGVRVEVIPDSYRLKELIVKHLSLDEMDDLCFKFKISLEDIEGEKTKDSKARNLIRQFERTQRMQELITELRNSRKGITWE